MTTPQHPTPPSFRPPSGPPMPPPGTQVPSMGGQVPPAGPPVPPMPPVTTRTIPAAPLGSAPGSERTMRTVLIVVAALLLVLTCGGLAVGAGVSASHRAAFAQIPASQQLGTPSDLTLSVPTSDVRVVVDPSADQIGLALVEEGDVSVGPDETVRARITHDGDRVTVEQPVLRTPSLQKTYRDVLMTVPASLSDSFSLHVDAATGDVGITGGSFEDLAVSTGVGDVDLQDLAVSGDLDIDTGAGDTNVRLTDDATPHSVALESGVGSLDLRVPHGMTFQVDGPADGLGDVDIAPDVEADSGPELHLSTSTGDVTVSH